MKPRILASVLAVYALATCALALDATLAGSPVNELLARADALLRGGSTAQAIELFDAVYERDGSYLTLYKRAVAYSSLPNQARKALDDFEAVLRLTEFDKARLHIARIHLKAGALEEAKQANDALLKLHKGHAEGNALKNTIHDASKRLSTAKRDSAKKQWPQCISSTTAALDLSPNSIELRDMRARCYLGQGQLDEAVGDFTRLSMLNPSAASTLLLLYHLNYFWLDNDAERGSQPLKQCLRFDPDSKECLKAHKSFRRIEKEKGRVRNFLEAGQWRQAYDVLYGPKSLVDEIESACTDFSQSQGGPNVGSAQLLTWALTEACKAYNQIGAPRTASQSPCERLLQRDPGNVEGLMGRGDQQLKRDEFEEAVRTFQDAFEKSGRSRQDVLDRLQKAQALLKRSKAKDYYKVLGVARDADERTIKRAYRRATVKAHPDKEGGSEAKMAALNEAYEVLSKPELKARYDNGDDPNDPQAQQGHNPFANHGGGQQFFFHQGGGGNFFQHQGGTFHFQFRG